MLPFQLLSYQKQSNVQICKFQKCRDGAFIFCHIVKMEKLIDLLNQCMKEQWKSFRFTKIEDADFFLIHDERNWFNWLWYETVFSKKFWFIARLVEKDKINSDIWFNYNGRNLSFKRELVSKKHENIIRTHTTLMILSIQDNPVKFLISLLK